MLWSLSLAAFVVGSVLVLWVAARWGLDRAVLALGVVLSGTLWAALEGAGQPRPAHLGMAVQLQVVAVQLDPGRAIWAWTPGDPPVAYELPWNEETARAMQELLDEAAQDGDDEGIMLEWDYTAQGGTPRRTNETPDDKT